MSERVLRDEFIVDLLAIKERAARLGLWRTFHALDRATSKVGWEVALLTSTNSREVPDE